MSGGPFTETALRQAEARAEWVRRWWTENKWLGAKGAVPEVRNLCDDVVTLAADLRERPSDAALVEALERIVYLSREQHPERLDDVAAEIHALATAQLAAVRPDAEPKE